MGIRFYEPGEEINYLVSMNSLRVISRSRIPAGEANHVNRGEFTFPRDAQLRAYMPHMHLRGKAAKYVAYYPDGREEVLLEVPKYDFNWQRNYHYREPTAVPKGTRIETTYWWDNSADNPSNPDPTAEVKFAGKTTDEMGFGYMSYLESEPRKIVVGDPIPEDILQRYDRKLEPDSQGQATLDCLRREGRLIEKTPGL